MKPNKQMVEGKSLLWQKEEERILREYNLACERWEYYTKMEKEAREWSEIWRLKWLSH